MNDTETEAKLEAMRAEVARAQQEQAMGSLWPAAAKWEEAQALARDLAAHFSQLATDYQERMDKVAGMALAADNGTLERKLPPLSEWRSAPHYAHYRRDQCVVPQAGGAKLRVSVWLSGVRWGWSVELEAADRPLGQPRPGSKGHGFGMKVGAARVAARYAKEQGWLDSDSVELSLASE